MDVDINQKQSCKRVKFTPEEDQKLKALYKQYGTNWKIISTFLENRTPRQCRSRFQNYLAPGFFNSRWTKEEDELLYQKFQIYGDNWKKIKKFFPGRTSNSLKKRWNFYAANFISSLNSFHEPMQNEAETSNPITLIHPNQQQYPQTIQYFFVMPMDFDPTTNAFYALTYQ